MNTNHFKHNIDENGLKRIIIPDFIKLNKSSITTKMRNFILNKKKPIKIKLTPVISQKLLKIKNNVKEVNNTYNTYNDDSNQLYLSPSLKEKSIDNYTINEIEMDKKINYSETRNIRNSKYNKNFSTPYRRINIKTQKSSSPSPNVVIKNFNYNNVYNISIENEKNEKNKNRIDNNKILNNTNNDINRFTHKYITYNKPKTTTNMNMKSSISKKKDNSNIVYNDIIIINKNEKNKRETFYSRFISEGKNIDTINNIKEDNSIINSTFSPMDQNNYKIENEKILSKSQDKIKKNKINNISFIYKTSIRIDKKNFDRKSISIDKNNFDKKSISIEKIDKRNINRKFYENDESCLYEINTKGISNIYNQKLSPNNTSFVKTINYTPKIFNPYINQNNNENTNLIAFNIKDLNIFQNKINNILFNIKNINSNYDIELHNPCYEFINYYSNSHLKRIIETVFKVNNKLIIDSSVNLSIFSIIIIYHLSKNNLLSIDLIKLIYNILFSLKRNFALYFKKIQLFYKINNLKKYKCFQENNKFLLESNITNVDNEVNITFKIFQNCKQMAKEIKVIIEYYKKININYYNSFINKFNNISNQKENDLINFFYMKIAKKNNSINLLTIGKNNINSHMNRPIKITHKLRKNKTNINIGIFPPKKNIFENLSIKRDNNKFKKFIINSVKKEKKEKIKTIQIPYIKIQSNKKYTLVLDLNKTLAYYNNKNGKVKIRNGLFSFLSMLKSYYELISFSCEPTNITELILKEIESERKYFDYNLIREHSVLYENKLVKDISLIGRDISKIIIIDDDESCFMLNKENGIKIASFTDINKRDNILFELKKILILIYKNNYDDVRVGIKDFSNDIKKKVSLC